MIRDTSQQDVPRQASGPARRTRRWLMPAVGALCVLGIAAAWPTVAKWSRSSLSLDAARLRTAVVERGQFVRDVSVQGQIVAAVRPMLYAPEDGRVTLAVRSGDRVASGDMLARIDAPELLSELEQEQSTLRRLESELARQRIETRMQNLQQKEELDLAEMELVAAERELRRAEAAHGHNAIPEQDYEKAVDDRDRASAVFRHQKEETLLRTERLELELDILEHDLERQRLTVDNLARKVAALDIKSPVDGVVGNLEVEQKSVVSRHQAILTVVDMSAYEVEASVPETYADELVQGLPVDIDFAGDHFNGELTAISPEVREGQVRTRIRFAGHTPPGLRQNQRVGARILLDSREQVLMVARGAFMQSGALGHAYVVDDDVAVRTPFQAGMISAGKIEIISGLEEGQRIVISSSDVFEDHERVLLLQ